METLSPLLGLFRGDNPWEPPHKGPVMQVFDGFFHVSLSRVLHKQSSCQWDVDTKVNYASTPPVNMAMDTPPVTMVITGVGQFSL